MEQSLFYDWIAKRFPKLTIQISEEILKKEPTYYHQRMLNKKYSLDGSWESISGEYKHVAADIVSMDSRLDIKKRDSIKQASGDIPKVGMKKALTEKQMKLIDTLIASNVNGVNDKQILTELFSDLSSCVAGVYERNEMSFLQGLSTGLILTDREDDASIGVRANFGYYDSHKLTAAFDWSDPNTSTPISDIDNVLEQAETDGYTLSIMILKPAKLNQLRRSKEMIAEYAASQGNDPTNTPVSRANLIQWFADEKGLTIEEMKRTVKIEKDGVRSVVDPWESNTVAFLTDWSVGDLVWSKLAEMNHSAKQVTYATTDDYILASKYHDVDPIKEFTSSQAMVLPIITDIGGIYLLNTVAEQGDSVSVNPTSVDFPVTGGAQSVTVAASGAFSVANAPTGITATVNGNTIDVVAADNSAGTAISGNIEVVLDSDPTVKAVIAVTQPGAARKTAK